MGCPRGIITGDPRFLRLLDTIGRVAPTPVPVLLQGESGTGKELLARLLHERSGRVARPFLALNCAALCETLAESELFGHVSGAFTGALRDRKGIFEEAAGGTLFLDEIGDLSPAIQGKLLRVLQEGIIYRVGDATPRPVRFRLVAATHKDLGEETRRGSFREDLFYRIHVVPIVLPPLRERQGDVRLLVRALLPRLAESFGKPVAGVSDEVALLLESYPWPGNVRELENELKRMVALAEPGIVLDRRHLSERIRNGYRESSPEPATLQEKLDRLERSEILEVLDRTGGNKTRAARELGLSRQGLKNKLARYGIERETANDGEDTIGTAPEEKCVLSD
ncbi:MAG: sigma 54-interacting transcriptional regulator [Candidatus Eisenbacteria bacterium]|nr:sigma 54-interacting transcriptional regulator [Candidatus Eisenbacteria bacterium]